MAGDLVLLTGASGFIAAHCLDQLLKKGYKVRGTVRSQDKADSIRKQYPNAALEFAIVPDVAQPHCFNEAVKGVDYILHVASPFHMNAKDNREVVDPAVQGTKSILEAAASEPKVKKLVITSSFAAILDSAKGKAANTTYSEKDWNPVTWEQGLNGDAMTGYRASKTFAEKAMWDFVKEKKHHFDVAAINPPLVFGPLLNSQQLSSLNTSNQRVWSYLSGQTKELDGACSAWVDVRDVATAHILAMEKKGSSERYFNTAGLFTSQLLANILRKHFPQYADRIPKGNPDNDKIPPLSEQYQVDNRKSRELGVTYIGLEQCIVDTANSLIKLAKQEGKLQ